MLLPALLLVMTCVQARAGADSLRAVWNNAALPDSTRFRAINAFYEGFSYSLPNQATQLARAHYAFAQERSVPLEMARALNEQALQWLLASQPDSALACLQRERTLRTSLNDTAGVARLCANMGTLYRQVGNFQESVRCYVLGLEHFRKHGDASTQARMLSGIAGAYQEVQLYDLAMQCLNEA